MGLLLSCNHVYNQVIFLDDHDETLKRLEASARNMNSLAAYSRSNAINREWIEMYLNEAHSQGLRLRKVPLQRHGMGRERIGVEAHPQRR